MNEDKYKEILISQSESKYGDSYKKDIIQLYRIYVEMADRISSRRQTANSFFLSINTVLAGIASYNYFNLQNLIYLVISIAGIVLCFTWYRLIRSYRDINSGKFKIIHEIEKKLPLAMYDAEWEALGRGKNNKIYLQFTIVESLVPIIFAFIHLLVILLSFITPMV